ncbi:hypothetical protein I302_100825 [Kwoniella bestiolae CBS 10118]|uniref:Uncharacterized protein n=1 Tax=Kwoniella bestiolae CBS 10118 TaxID=1296100 RepID=A0A1B9G696_9TREE|nr:hypothetical protein I302_04198 [Kwoniella bestiolae CBS 10118]OCF26512.1 hypothetical protein I302_04198 [Kwoniella bestiolae CBS 10118]
MPPPPSRDPADTHTNVVQPTATAQQNTRALLRSLEDLRDSLSTRVEHLSNAVERLRGQAGELERALEGENGNGNVAGNGVQREPRDPTRSRQRARDIVSAYENRENPSSPPTVQYRVDPPPIAQLSRPITSDEIHTLLNRASASGPNTSAREDPWISRAQNIESRIRRLSETARELRLRSSPSSSSSSSAPAVLPSISGDTGASERERERERERDRPDDLLRGVLNRARELREDQDRLEDGIRRLNGSSNIERSGARTPQIVPAPTGSNRRRSRHATTGVIPISRSRSRGLRPTNILEVERQPSPEIVRSTPVSPASTIRPTCDDADVDESQPVNVNGTNGHSASPPSSSSTTNPPNPISILNQPVPPRPSARLSNTDLMDMARNIVEGITNPNINPQRENSNNNNNISPLSRRNARRDSSLTFRGRRVEASMAQNQRQGTASRNVARDDNDEMDENEALRTWPFLAQLLQHPFPTMTTTTTTTTTNNARTGRRDTPQARGESPMEETVRLIQQDQGRGIDEFRSFLLEGDDLPIPGLGYVPPVGNDTERRSRRRSEWSSPWDARDPSDRDGDEEGEVIEEHTVVVIDMTTTPPTEQVLPRFLMGQPHRRSTEEAERIRDDRRVANERVRVLENRREMERTRNGHQGEDADAGWRRVTESDLDHDLGLQPGLGVGESEHELPITPTQGISMADLENGMEGVMRALIIDDNEIASEDESESETTSESGSGEGTIFEGEGERVEGGNVAINGHGHGQATTAHNSITTLIDQRVPPKESFDTDLHLWPSHYSLVGVGSM